MEGLFVVQFRITTWLPVGRRPLFRRQSNQAIFDNFQVTQEKLLYSLEYCSNISRSLTAQERIKYGRLLKVRDGEGPAGVCDSEEYPSQQSGPRS